MNIVKPKNLMVLSLSILLVACGNDISRLSDDDLRKKIQECDYAIESEMTAAEHQVCDNYHRECKRRFDEGRFVCN
ncbi:MAG: hypothetical protein HWE18_04490 [Gammaproteobacteria bacterium]|nr:hypothetical protein [Gammaproteobacteria bacterium]